MLGSKINLQEQLEKIKKQNTPDLLKQAKDILDEDHSIEGRILAELNAGKRVEESTDVNMDLLDKNRIYTKNQIKELCLTYRLRFVNSNMFKNDIPQETVFKIKAEEKKLNTTFKNLKIIAPKRTLELGDCDGDPLLFASLGNNEFYLLDQWGDDLNAWRKIWAWPIRNAKNWLTFTAVLTLLLVAITPSNWISTHPNGPSGFIVLSYLLELFFGINVFMVFIGMAFHKNFTVFEWNRNSFN